MSKRYRCHNAANNTNKRPVVISSHRIVSHGKTANQVHELVKELNAIAARKQAGGSRKQSYVASLSQMEGEPGRRRKNKSGVKGPIKGKK